MRISEYTRATEPLTGREVFVLNQQGVTYNTTLSALWESDPADFYLSSKENYLDTPLEDNYVLSSTVSGVRYWRKIDEVTNYLSEIYNQDGSLSLYDFVYQEGLGKQVSKVVNNKSSNPVIGIVTKVLSFDEVQVTYLGTFFVSDVTLEEGQKVFIGEDGYITTTVPNYNYVQVVGHAVSSNIIHLSPEVKRVKRLLWR